MADQPLVVKGAPVEVTSADHQALKEMIATRFTAMQDVMDAKESAMVAQVASATARAVAAEETFRHLLKEADRRYQERFEAQGQALSAAFISAEKAVEAALNSAERAVMKAEAASEKRFESVNEFRNALSDQAARLMTRTEVEAALRSIVDKIDGPAGVASQLTALRGRGLGRDETRARYVDTNRDWIALGAAAVAALALLLAFWRQTPSVTPAYEAAPPPSYPIPTK